MWLKFFYVLELIKINQLLPDFDFPQDVWAIESILCPLDATPDRSRSKNLQIFDVRRSFVNLMPQIKVYSAIISNHGLWEAFILKNTAHQDGW